MTKRKRLRRLERMNERLAEHAAAWQRVALDRGRVMAEYRFAYEAATDAFHDAHVEICRLICERDNALAGLRATNAHTVKLLQQYHDARRWAAAWKHAATMERCARLIRAEVAASHDGREKVLTDLLRGWLARDPDGPLADDTREALRCNH